VNLSPTTKLVLPKAQKVVAEANKELEQAVRKLISKKALATRVKNKILEAQQKLTKNDRDQAIFSKLNEALWLLMKM